jgi:two-component system, cell cycle sensor histidine kinase and response regulator CckA
MAGAMAHEVRSPLCVILGYSSEILEMLPPDHAHRKFVEVIHRCATRCNELAEKLLRFSRRPKEAETFPLDGAVEEALTLARLGRKSFGVEFATDLKDAIEITGRRNEIQQIVVNLCTNAIDAMPNGGTLTVRTCAEHRADRDWAVISVEDTGIGIPEEIRKRIFDPFFTTKPAGVGTGLGLSIVRDIARSCSGALELHSELGKGSTFHFRLPLPKTAASESTSETGLAKTAS